jgi:DNA polymerase III subunit gamma/tau
MATQALYRRYRPRRFSELKGQDHVVLALRNAVIHGREGQAYLFSGPRGTGKTTSARILAKVLNCENPQNGEPCCECPSCLAVEQGVSYDVHELDAASNNGVDAMRDLIEKAALGTPGRHKVYILDEVHMLSKGAEAALLKTLEEPPPHVVFVLATTDPHKVSDTIRSRTQHLQFHLLPMDVLESHVRWLVADAGLDVSDDTLQGVLQQGGGSARDTLSALELAASTGGVVADTASLDECIEALVNHDAGQALATVAHAVQVGRDPRTLTEDLIRHLRDCFLSMMAPELVQLPVRRADQIAEQATRLGSAAIVRAMERLGTMLVDMRHAPDPRVLLDVALVQLASPAAAGDVGALAARVERLEQAVNAGGVPAPAEPRQPAPVDPATGRTAIGGRAKMAGGSAGSKKAAASASEPVTEQAPEPADAQEPAAQEPAAPPAELVVPGREPVAQAADSGGDVVTVYEQQVRPALKGMAKAMFMGAHVVGVRDGALVLAFAGDVHRNRAKEFVADVEKALAASGAAVTVSLVVDGAATSSPSADAVTAGAVTDNVVRMPIPADVAADDDVDLHDLVDAPPEAVVSPIDRLAQAFPGSEVIDERS